MRALVTGGAGFIGSHVVDRLVSQGADAVLIVDDLSSGRRENPPPSADIVEMDIQSPDLAATVKQFRPEVVFHLAAQVSVIVSVRDPGLDARVNVLGTINVLDACVEAGARKVVFASSGGTVYGEPPAEDLPVGESYHGVPTSPYGITKKVTHDYLAFYKAVHGLDYAAMALSNVYGPRQDPHGEAGVVAIWSELMLAGRECLLFGDGEQTRDFVFVADVADAFVRAAGIDGGDVINIGTGVQTSVNELYREMAKSLGVDAGPVYKPARDGELRRIALDVSRAERLMGWKPTTTVPDGIAQTTAWFASKNR